LWVALLGGLLMAAVLGSAIGSSDMRMAAVIIGLIPLVVLFVHLKTNIWVLIPIGWYVGGRLPWLPLPLSVRDICLLLAIGFYIGFFAMRIVPWQRKRTMLDYLILINLAYLATVYFRNPVGTWAMQSSMVGGRPYFDIAMAFLAFLILSRVNLSDLVAKIFPLFFVIPTWCLAVLELVTRLFPQTAFPLGAIYSGVGSSSSMGGMFEEEQKLGETRFTGLVFAGLSSLLALYAKYPPITLVSPLFPGRVLMAGVSLGTVFLSGFRGALFFAMAAFLLASVLRGRLRDLWISGGMLFLALVAVIALQGTILQLPLTMQRSLSWLPGDWNEATVRDAQGSSQWRFDMWKWAWEDNRIMRDKVWGQGFGFNLEDMNIIANALLAGQTGGAFLGGSQQESFIIMGSFHSGPLSTIKVIGVVGFLLYYPLLCYMALVAWRLCVQSRGKKVFPLALFVGIPVIYEPFNFIVIFGALDSNYPQMLLWAGLLNMIKRYLDVSTTPPQTAPAAPSQSKRAMVSGAHA
jgi:hypothetical protein